jgi:4a-hydroxytetrahydrobiopterin dehydratase
MKNAERRMKNTVPAPYCRSSFVIRHSSFFIRHSSFWAFHPGVLMAQKEKTYNDAEIATRLEQLPGWYFEDGWIRRVYKTDGWPTTLMLVNAIGYLAEAAYHHPDLAVTWGRVQVKLSTHSAGGITDKDFELARRIEDAALWRPAGGALTGTPNKWVRSGDPRG